MKKIIFVSVILTLLLNANDFTKQGALVYDAKTGLKWETNPSSKKFSWSEAKRYCQDKSMRLPNIDELKSLVDYSKYNPAIRTNLIHIKTDDYYWSSSEVVSNSSNVWDVRFKYGDDYWNDKTDKYYALCVRG